MAGVVLVVLALSFAVALVVAALSSVRVGTAATDDVAANDGVGARGDWVRQDGGGEDGEAEESEGLHLWDGEEIERD